jgi:hypothetical protein
VAGASFVVSRPLPCPSQKMCHTADASGSGVAYRGGEVGRIPVR